MISTYQARKFSLALPFPEKNEKKLSNIENIGGTHFVLL